MREESKFDADLRSAAAGFVTLPPSSAPAPKDRLVRSALTALATGAGTYTLLPSLFHTNTSGVQDEQAALYAAIAALLLASIRDVKQLCWDAVTTPAEERLELAKGGAGGFIGGTAIASLTPQLLFSLVDGGVLLLSTAVGFLFAAAVSQTKRAKKCPHCGHLGKCSQRICRNCYRIFWPPAIEFDCSRQFVLTWSQIAAFLQQHGLNYLILWISLSSMLQTGTFCHALECSKSIARPFTNGRWMPRRRFSVRRAPGAPSMSAQERDDYLTKRNL